MKFEEMHTYFINLCTSLKIWNKAKNEQLYKEMKKSDYIYKSKCACNEWELYMYTVEITTVNGRQSTQTNKCVGDVPAAAWSGIVSTRDTSGTLGPVQRYRNMCT